MWWFGPVQDWVKRYRDYFVVGRNITRIGFNWYIYLVLDWRRGIMWTDDWAVDYICLFWCFGLNLFRRLVLMCGLLYEKRRVMGLVVWILRVYGWASGGLYRFLLYFQKLCWAFNIVLGLRNLTLDLAWFCFMFLFVSFWANLRSWVYVPGLG